MEKTCFLLGFMGSGKTYWGRRLSKRLQVPFVDLDEVIETGEGQDIASIFAHAGEAAFRRLEQGYLRALALQPPKVVAVGGGTPCFFDNMAWMRTHGITIYLEASVPVLAARLRTDGATRPLLQAVPKGDLEAHIARLLEQRASVYRLAHAVVPVEADEAGFLGKLALLCEDATRPI